MNSSCLHHTRLLSSSCFIENHSKCNLNWWGIGTSVTVVIRCYRHARFCHVYTWVVKNWPVTCNFCICFFSIFIFIWENNKYLFYCLFFVVRRRFIKQHHANVDLIYFHFNFFLYCVFPSCYYYYTLFILIALFHCWGAYVKKTHKK